MIRTTGIPERNGIVRPYSNSFVFQSGRDAILLAQLRTVSPMAGAGTRPISGGLRVPAMGGMSTNRMISLTRIQERNGVARPYSNSFVFQNGRDATLLAQVRTVSPMGDDRTGPSSEELRGVAGDGMTTNVLGRMSTFAMQRREYGFPLNGPENARSAVVTIDKQYRYPWEHEKAVTTVDELERRKQLVSVPEDVRFPSEDGSSRIAQVALVRRRVPVDIPEEFRLPGEDGNSRISAFALLMRNGPVRVPERFRAPWEDSSSRTSAVRLARRMELVKIPEESRLPGEDGNSRISAFALCMRNRPVRLPEEVRAPWEDSSSRISAVRLARRMELVNIPEESRLPGEDASSTISAFDLGMRRFVPSAPKRPPEGDGQPRNSIEAKAPEHSEETELFDDLFGSDILSVDTNNTAKLLDSIQAEEPEDLEETALFEGLFDSDVLSVDTDNLEPSEQAKLFGDLFGPDFLRTDTDNTVPSPDVPGEVGKENSQLVCIDDWQQDSVHGQSSEKTEQYQRGTGFVGAPADTGMLKPTPSSVEHWGSRVGDKTGAATSTADKRKSKKRKSADIPVRVPVGYRRPGENNTTRISARKLPALMHRRARVSVPVPYRRGEEDDSTRISRGALENRMSRQKQNAAIFYESGTKYSQPTEFGSLEQYATDGKLSKKPRLNQQSVDLAVMPVIKPVETVEIEALEELDLSKDLVEVESFEDWDVERLT